jgi:hypothetical protein
MLEAMRWLIAALVLLLAVAPAAAQKLDAGSEEALAETLRMLRDPAQRGAAISGSPQAAGVDKNLQELLGNSPQLNQEFYELAAAIMQDLTRASGGDVTKMSETLERAKADPAAFAALLSPATLQKLNALSVKISDRPR